MTTVGSTIPKFLFTYVQDSEPNPPVGPEEGESWFDTANDEVKVYNGSSWQKTGVVSHDALVDVADADHHAYPVPTAGIDTDAVTTAKIAADAVTNALIAADAVDTAQLALDAVTTSEIAANAVTNALIANGAVDTEQLAAGAVTSGEIADGQVGLAELGFDPATQNELDNHAAPSDAHHTYPVPTGGLADQAVSTAKLALGAVDTSQIATGAVTSGEIANGQVGGSELAFDPATQNELNNHAGNSTAHHSPPTSTQSTGTSFTVDFSQFTLSNPEFDINGEPIRYGPAYVSTITAYSNDYADLEILLGDGTLQVASSLTSGEDGDTITVNDVVVGLSVADSDHSATIVSIDGEIVPGSHAHYI
ncbi:hypothetical protein [Halorhabdus amylolytica]|uniref:hypothetical protein n=1 Tax=Halorhabdus amylolytica TaxID=2559573 RepID=UPI0010AA293D|nr:hypothetical protein [Halorhabdus amylolytica]